MREALITTPCVGNDDATDLWEHITWVRDRMVKAFGGATVTGPHWGAWFDEGAGRVQEERVMQITSAFEATPENEQTLLVIARAFGMSAKQKCVYVRFPDGRVRIIETQHLWDKTHPQFAEHSYPRLSKTAA